MDSYVASITARKIGKLQYICKRVSSTQNRDDKMNVSSFNSNYLLKAIYVLGLYKLEALLWSIGAFLACIRCDVIKSKVVFYWSKASYHLTCSMFT